MPKKIKFFPIEVLEYKNGIFSAGLLKNSPHKYDYYFLRIFDTYFHLRSDEMASVGAKLKAGDPVGHPSCEGG